MTIPFMAEFVSGAARDPAEAEIVNLYVNLGWYFRALDEISLAAELDKGKVKWLMTHCPAYRAAFAALQARIGREGVSADNDWPAIRSSGEIIGMIEGFLAAKKLRWGARAVLIADLSAVNGDALSVSDWIAANVPDWGSNFATRSVVGAAPDGKPIEAEVTTKVALPPELMTRVQALRARFGPRPA